MASKRMRCMVFVAGVLLAAAGTTPSTASGPGYHLDVAASPAGTGVPCCCVALPCVLR